MLVIYINLLSLPLFNQTFNWFVLCKTVVFGLGFGHFLYLPCVTLVPLDSLLQVLVVQVGRGVRGFQGCQAHHLFLVVQHFPREKWRGLFSLSQLSPEVEGLKKMIMVLHREAGQHLVPNLILVITQTGAWSCLHTFVSVMLIVIGSIMIRYGCFYISVVIGLVNMALIQWDFA